LGEDGPPVFGGGAVGNGSSDSDSCIKSGGQSKRKKRAVEFSLATRVFGE
jgi:hypothetical protein